MPRPPAQQTNVLDTRSTSFEEPEDQFYEYPLYIQKFGDPTVRGHKVLTIDGVKGVLVPAERVWKIKRQRTQAVEVRHTVADLVPLDDEELHTRAQEMSAGFMAIQATGMSLDELLGSRPQVKAQSASDGSSHRAAASSSSSGFSAFAIVQDVGVPVHEANEEGNDDMLGGKRLAARSKGKVKAKASPVKPAPPLVSLEETPPATPKSAAKGRPKRDLDHALEKAINDFMQATSTSSYFGDESKTVKRFLERLLTDVDKKLDSTDNVDEYAAMNPRRKQLSAIVALLKSYFTHGMSSSGWIATFDAQEHFLSLEPCAPLPFPKFWVHARYEAKCSGEANPQAFWPMISKKALLNHGFADTEHTQVKLLSERVVSITKGCGSAHPEFVKQMSALAIAMPPGVQGFPCTLVDQVQIIKTMLVRTENADVILDAADKTKCEDFNILRSLTTFPRGRMLVEQAKAHATSMKADDEKNRSSRRW